MIRNGSAAVTTLSGSGASGDSLDTSFPQAKNRKNGRRCPRDLIADGPAQHGIARFQGIQDRTLRDRSLDLERHLAADACQGLQMRREHDSDHGNV